ncbi:BA14K family protein [Mesorhizobium sp. M3A.F.Ca.ET.080.04.2.1]|uniref:BA14K family protein n=1 Tax=Mesorhizobium sp. M3A.F.Ca.ET.080.04.2.1 TaxID=2493676 RepID=UPI000F75F45E|nr:BA14K family protein [Mesorhizobium sp. M3A.F.Ca.ET.080.04.2.1]AZO08837.1 BA14K family protein [Mesorhizobium sp. M3A.F.Ca.ET.080.04.2.1]RWF14233.1 MAG: BA14K family protein [Mesorhizobium sp.]
MKALLGIVGGFVLTLAVFASGLAFATWLLAAKPVRVATPAIGVSELWTRDAKPVDPAKQNLERLPAQQAAGVPAAGTAAKTGTQTAAVVAPAQAAPQPQTQTQAQTQTAVAPDASQPDAASAAQQQTAADLPAAHLEWCANRYRSYRPQENSYRSYSGELRPCISPYLDPGRSASIGGRQDNQDEVSDDQAETEGYATSSDGFATTYGDPPEEEQVLSADPQASADHVDYCFSRYRSYRPEDNSYQPYDGGPRRQCE